MSVLWYKEEAHCWEEALPLGNGRIGAMVYSGPLSDRIQMNEDTLWSGNPMSSDKNHSSKNKDGYVHSLEQMQEVRRLIRKEEYVQAQQKLSELMLGVRCQAYVSYGELFLDLENNGEITEYRRELDLTSAVLRSSFKLNDMHIEKESFISLKDDVLVIHIKSDKPSNWHFYQAVELEHSVFADDKYQGIVGRCPTYINSELNAVEYTDEESIHFCSMLRANTDGQMYGGGNSLWIKSAYETTLYFSIKTSFNGYDKMPVSQGKEYVEAAKKVLCQVEQYSYKEIVQRHVEEYQKYYNRTYLRIDGPDLDHIPTDIRIKNMAEGCDDNELVTILFDYGKYLTISSSMEGTQPANLQGIWCRHLIAPWHSNYTMNINTEMNYWPTETLDLPECHRPYLKMIKELAEKGNTYGLRGWASWHNSDIWRFNHEATTNVQCGFWIMGGFWSLRHVWEHYLHTRDIEMLREFYPIMLGAAQFLEDWMIEDEDGYLVTSPSTSPENSFIWNGCSCSLCEGSAMDMSIVYDVFDQAIQAAQVLGEDYSYLEAIIKRLKPVQIGNDGRILEWGKEFQEAEIGHRHISHLYGLYPSDIWKTKEYIEAAKESLRVRLAHGGGHTGWSNAWIACVYARLKDGEGVNRHIRNMFCKSIYPNMFDAHPPFQIDGNFGICAAICEALMQSHSGKVELLPALPKGWKSGEVRGFKTRTGEKINFMWEQGKITNFAVNEER